MEALENLNLQAITLEESMTIDAGGWWSDFFDGLIDGIKGR